MIQVNNITISFDTNLVFDHFSCEISLDGNTLLRGASGSGKTTLLRALAGLIHPDSGTITGISSMKIATVFQEDRLLPWLTALENVALVSDLERAACALSALGLYDSIGLKPSELSGGMKRRVSLARALAYGGDLLLLDEPFTGLDDAAKQLAARIILNERVPVIAAVHGDDDSSLLHAKYSIQII